VKLRRKVIRVLPIDGWGKAKELLLFAHEAVSRLRRNLGRDRQKKAFICRINDADERRSARPAFWAIALETTLVV
jgi:hypothetical protein